MMKISKISFMILRKNPIMNLITILQLTVVFLLTAVMASSCWVRYQYYSPFSDCFKSKGFYVNWSLRPTDSSNVCYDSNRIKAALPHVKEVISCHDAAILPSENYLLDFIRLVYDDEIIERFVPELNEGKWLSLTSAPDEIEAVITKNPYGWKVGDSIRMELPGIQEQSLCFTVHIVGELKENGRIFGIGSRGRNGLSCNVVFYPYSVDIEERPIMIFSKSAIDHLEAEAEEFNSIPRESVFYDSIILAEDNATEQDLLELQRELVLLGSPLIVPMNEFHANSMDYLLAQVHTLLPVFIIVFILTLVSCISNSALITNRRLRDYAIYYTLGLTWRHCALISMMNTLFQILSALLLMCLFYAAAVSTPLHMSIYISSGVFVQMCIGLLVMICLLISMIMPAMILHRQKPRQILTR